MNFGGNAFRGRDFPTNFQIPRRRDDWDMGNSTPRDNFLSSDMDPPSWGQRQSFLSGNLNHDDYEQQFYGYSNSSGSNHYQGTGSYQNRYTLPPSNFSSNKAYNFKRKWEKTNKPEKNYGEYKNSGSYVNLDDSLPQEVKVMFDPVQCKLCQADLTSTVMAKVHYSSNAHEKRLRKWLIEYSERTGEPLHKRATIQPKKDDQDADPKYFHCSDCDIPLTGKLHAESHYMGKSHQSVVIGRQAPPRKKKNTSNLSGSPFNCEICGISMTSSSQMDAHISGQKHKKKVKALEEGKEETSRPATPISAMETDNGSNSNSSLGLSCDVCCISFNSKLQQMQHLTSKKHEKKVEAKQNKTEVSTVDPEETTK